MIKNSKWLGMTLSTAASVLILSACGGGAPAAPETPGADTTPTEASSDGQAPAVEAKKSSWKIVIDDTKDLVFGPTKLKMNMKMNATKQGGDVGGDYQATATAKIDTFTAIAEGTGTTDTGSQSAPFNFTVKPFVALAPLAPKDNLEPVALVPNPEWEADGEITMATAGEAIIDGAVKGGMNENSTLPFHLTILNEKVTVTIPFPDIGEQSFYGALKNGN